MTTSIQNNVDAEFMGIKLRHWPEDRIFNLFNKYKIRDTETGVEFVKTYLGTLSTSKCNSYRIKDTDVGINLSDMENKNIEIFERFIEGNDFNTTIETVYKPGDIIDALRKHYAANGVAVPFVTQPDRNEFMRGYTSHQRTTHHMTIPGLLKAYEIMPPSMFGECMDTALSKLIMWAAVLSDTDNGNSVYGIVGGL